MRHPAQTSGAAAAVMPVVGLLLRKRWGVCDNRKIFLLSGFPLADSAYYENPSPSIAGLLLMHLMGEIQTRQIFFPPGSTYFSPPVTHFESLKELKQYLEEKHQDNYWYRGQQQQHRCSPEELDSFLSECKVSGDERRCIVNLRAAELL